MPVRLPIPLLAALIVLFNACGDAAPAGPQAPRSGPWRMELALVDTIARTTHALPFLFDLEHADSTWRMHIHNGEETITVDEITSTGDSLHIRMPLYDSEFHGRVLNDSTITGQWHNLQKGPNYRIAFTAKAGNAPRFAAAQPGSRVGGQWETHIGSEEKTPAIGLFRQEPNGRVTGTFATETVGSPGTELEFAL